MREKFYCQSTGPNNGINRAIFVRDNYKNTGSQPEIMSVNTTTDVFIQGATYMVEITLFSTPGSNGREPHGG